MPSLERGGRALAVHALLLQEARRLGLAPEPRALGAGRRETDDEALIRAVIEACIAPAPPTEAACRAIYTRHPSHRFRAPTIYAAAHILLPVAPEDAAGRSAAR